ncbi:TPA: hypothetical protein ACH3X1_015964 [Trebouxia sp. C0004]
MKEEAGYHHERAQKAECKSTYKLTTIVRSSVVCFIASGALLTPCLQTIVDLTVTILLLVLTPAAASLFTGNWQRWPRGPKDSAQLYPCFGVLCMFSHTHQPKPSSSK